ncbi:MAG TPA: LptF/LptG family permease [Phycisphaerae bacterium]|nr:LptF/LptG family permease [Phycisphaerae bacterium]
MRILDRYIVKAFVFNYLLSLVVLVGMAILLDLIVNLDSFSKSAGLAGATQANTSAGGALWNILDYYSYQSLVIFQTVSGAIPLLAAGFTMVRMTRHHELTAMLASGVSLFRVALPVVLVSVVFGLLTVVNQEWIISQPDVVQKLLRRHDEVGVPVTKTESIYFVQDPRDNSLLVASSYDPAKKEMKGVLIVQRDEKGAPIGHIAADRATWELPPNETSEAWMLRGRVIQSEDRLDADPTKRFVGNVEQQVYQTGLTPQQLDLMFRKKAVDYLSTSQVRELAASSPPANQPLLYKVMDLRVTQPLMNIIMLLIGVPFLLTREPNRLIKNMVYCTIVSGLVFVATFVMFQMAGTKLDPLLAAWLPVMIFGPCAIVMLDTIRT